jgi:Kef-type K+ transport system membrane component KefB
VRAAGVLGLAFLLFLAGLEIDVQHFRGPRARRALSGLALSAVLGITCGLVLHAVGLAQNPLLIATVLMATSLGLIVPVLKDAGAAELPVGQLAIAGASTGEVSAVVLLSLFFSQRGGAVGGRLLLLALLLLVTAVAVVVILRAERSSVISALVVRLADTTAQIRVRLAVLTLVGFAAIADRLGFEAILGAFLAGLLLRLVDADAMTRHPQFHIKLEGLGFGFLIPVFFVMSGVTFDLDALLQHPATLARVPLYLALLLLVRGLPAIFYRGELDTKGVVAAALLQSASLPFIVAATQIGLTLHAITAGNAAALVAAGLVSVLVYPVVALRLLAPARPVMRVPTASAARIAVDAM